mmetsp:Transcript_18918/g.38424  ORF Transcript_18918/g.38424 Transcript_18918/m.38424 type:complete len:253 (+) Transcript_18918:1161-1919(+)
MHQVDFESALDVRLVDLDLAVEAPRAQQRRVQDVCAVGAGEHHDARERVETVHLDQQLVQSVLALVVAAREPAAAPCTSHRVDLVHKHDAWCMCTGLAEEISDARGPDADKHLNEVGPADREEGHVRLPSHGLGHQGLASAGRPAQQRALRDLRPQVAELVGVAQELHKLFDLHLGLGESCHVLERHLVLVVSLDDRRLRLPNLEDVAWPAAGPRPAHATGHLPHDEDPEADDEQRGSELEQLLGPGRLVGV